jgi:hypothetical protein
MGPMIASDDPDYYRLTHRVFSGFSKPLFRRAEGDVVPVLVVELGDRAAVIPFDALMGEFGIGHDTEDHRMIAFIKRSLNFVGAPRRRSSSISMRRMIRCTANRKAGSSTAITTATAICRFIFLRPLSAGGDATAV